MPRIVFERPKFRIVVDDESSRTYCIETVGFRDAMGVARWDPVTSVSRKDTRLAEIPSVLLFDIIETVCGMSPKAEP